MAYLSQEQIRQILQNAPPNLDKGKIIAELAKTNTLQGYNEPAPQQDGFFKSLVKDPVKELIVRPGVRIAQAGIATFGGAKGQAFAEQDQNVSLPGLGNFNIPAQRAGLSGVKQIGGDALKSASYLYTPKLATTAITGARTLGQTALNAGIQTAKVGALTGAAYSAGDSLQKDQGLGETLKNTAIGAGTGAAVGFATGATISGLSNIPEKLKTSTIAKYDELFTGTKSGKKLLDKSVSQGKTPSKFLVDHNYIVDIEKGKVNATPTIEKIQTGAQQYDDVLDEILKVKDETIGTRGISLTQLADKVKRKIASSPQNRASGYLNQQLNQVDDIVGDLIVQYGDEVNYQTLNQIKQAQWKQASVFDMTRPNFAKDIHYNFGSVAKNEIQDAFTNQADIQGLNNYIGDHYNAIKNLQLLDGKAVKGGRLGTYFGRVIGATAGSSHGPVGSIVGAQVGDSVSTIMQNSYLTNPIKKVFLARLAESQPPGSAVMLEAQKALQLLQKESVQATAKASVMSTKYGLPAPDRIYAPGADKTSMKILPSDVSIQRNPKTGKMQKVFMGTSDQAQKGTGPIYQIKKVAGKVNDALNEVTPGLSIKNTPSKSLIQEARKGEYLYHGTNETVLDNISKEGLKPTNRGSISLSKDEAYSRSFAESSKFPRKEGQGVMFRVKADAVKTTPSKSGVPSDKLNELLVKETIPPEAIEVFKNGEWQPLKENPLLSEARKYKSAEEFVSKQPILFRSGEKGNFFSNSEKYVYEGGFKSPIREVVLPNNAKILDVKATNELDKLANTAELKVLQNHPTDTNLREVWDKILQRNGYDGMRFTEEGGSKTTFLTNPAKGKLLTKSQLTDIWKEANKGIGKRINDALNEVTPGLYTNSKYSITYNQKGSKKILKNLSRDEAKSWAQYFKEKGLKFTVKTLGTVATAVAVKNGTNRSAKK